MGQRLRDDAFGMPIKVLGPVAVIDFWGREFYTLG